MTVSVSLIRLAVAFAILAVASLLVMVEAPTVAEAVSQPVALTSDCGVICTGTTSGATGNIAP